MSREEEKPFLEKKLPAVGPVGRAVRSSYVLAAAIFLRLPDTKIAHTPRISERVKVLINVPRSTLRLSTIN